MVQNINISNNISKCATGFIIVKVFKVTFNMFVQILIVLCIVGAGMANNNNIKTLYCDAIKRMPGMFNPIKQYCNPYSATLHKWQPLYDDAWVAIRAIRVAIYVP